MSSTTDDSRLDVATIIAIGLVVYLIKNVVHEGLGHGVVCILVGGEAQAISSAWWDGTYEGVSAWGRRWVRAGGTFANLIVALLFFVAWRNSDANRRPTLTYFFWLSAVANLLSGGGYMMVDPIGQFGDWQAFLQGLEPQLPWRIAIIVVGVILSLLGVALGRLAIDPYLGRDTATRKSRARFLCWTPYFAGGLIFPISALLNPLGYGFVFTTALATLGGTAWLAWFLPFVVDKPGPRSIEPALGLRRSTPWLVAGLLSALITVFVLGPSIQL